MTVRKAVITAAGLGTRFLPASKAFQKEMVPVMHKPQLQWVIEEAMEAGITDIAVIIRKDKETLKDYLKDDDELFRWLKEVGKEEVMDSWAALREQVNMTFYYQTSDDPYGNGTPFLKARDFIGDEPFAAMWGDDIYIHHDKNYPVCTKQMIDIFEKEEPIAVMSAVEVPRTEINRYGSFEYHESDLSKSDFHVKKLVEKPEPDQAPSLMANAARFVLTPAVVEELGKQITGKDDEIWLTDSIDRLIQSGYKVIAPPWEGSYWVPVGDPLRWLKANILVSLHLPEYKNDVENMLKEINSDFL